MAETAFIAVGSNLDPEQHLPLAVARLSEIGRVLAFSRVYQNPAIGPAPEPDFLNAAVSVETELPPLEIRGRLRRIEADLDRVRGGDKYAPRTIDLDLCLCGAIVLESPELTLPSPEITRRAYLAVTLAELSPDFRHPLTGERLREIADRLRAGAQLIPRDDVALADPSA